MSRCPDAHACEASSDRVFGSRSSQGVIRDLVQPELVFIGKLNNESVPFGVDCMHGSQECRGNVQTLCMQGSSSCCSLFCSAPPLNQLLDNHEWKTWWPCELFNPVFHYTFRSLLNASPQSFNVSAGAASRLETKALLANAHL